MLYPAKQDLKKNNHSSIVNLVYSALLHYKEKNIRVLYTEIYIIINKVVTFTLYIQEVHKNQFFLRKTVLLGFLIHHIKNTAFFSFAGYGSRLIGANVSFTMIINIRNTSTQSTFFSNPCFILQSLIRHFIVNIMNVSHKCRFVLGIPRNLYINKV